MTKICYDTFSGFLDYSALSSCYNNSATDKDVISFEEFVNDTLVLAELERNGGRFERCLDIIHMLTQTEEWKNGNEKSLKDNQEIIYDVMPYWDVITKAAIAEIKQTLKLPINKKYYEYRY